MNYLEPTPRPLTAFECYLLKECTPTIYKLGKTLGAIYTPGRLPEHGQLPVKEQWFVELLHGEPLTFDTALPQLWLNHWLDVHYRLIAPDADERLNSAYDHVMFGTVWAYPEGHFGGLPFPLTRQAYELIKERYEK